jgi:hypothetical protein
VQKMTKVFGNGAYYSDPGQGYEPDWLVDEPRLHDHLPIHARERVERAWKRSTTSVRNRLESETCLGRTIAVPVKLVDGLPLVFAELIRQFDDPDLWWLITHRELFSATSKGLLEISNAVTLPRPLLRRAGADDSFRGLLEPVAAVILRLLESKQAEQLDEKLRSIDRDVLGAYFFRRREIQLYWMVIAFYAAILQVSIEDLTFVVLTHELAHAYTHLGGDADRTTWETDDFAATDLRIVEGLAQFYTESVVVDVELDRTQPGARTAFDALLSRQSVPYTIFKGWTDPAEPRRSEIVRTAMIQTRTTRNTDYNVFRQTLERVRQAAPRPEHRDVMPIR